MDFVWPKVVLFGDSHTQRSFDPNSGCWGAFLANKLQRACDVVQRGFSGYNTRSCKLIMPKVFEPFNCKEVACVTIFLGSNDACDASSPTGQHVPLDEYKSNLASMVEYLESIGIPKSRLILICPPNYFHETFINWCHSEGRPKCPINSNENIQCYAEACQNVATQKGVTVLNLFPIFSNYPQSETLFSDGLHLSFSGAKLIFEHLTPLIIEKVENFTGKQLEKITKFPYWASIDYGNLEFSLFAPQ